MTGAEQLLNMLIKLFRLEAEVETLRATLTQAAKEDILGQVKQTLELVGTFDERLARIERALGIKPDTGSIVFFGKPEPNSDFAAQRGNGTDQ